MFVFNYMYLRKKAFSCKGVVIPDAETRVRTLFPATAHRADAGQHRSGLLRPETFFTRLFFFFFLHAKLEKFYYHSWPTESGKHNYEIDFLLSRGTKILPVEVKSSSYKTHASLDAFCKKYSSRITNERCLVFTKDYDREESVKYLPAYMAYFL